LELVLQYTDGRELIIALIEVKTDMSLPETERATMLASLSNPDAPVILSNNKVRAGSRDVTNETSGKILLQVSFTNRRRMELILSRSPAKSTRAAATSS
jgi:hypothetical protein